MNLDNLSQWRWVPGMEGRYEISNFGEVRSHVKNKILLLRPGIASHGYPTVSLAGKTYTVHSLVMRAWCGPRPEGNFVRHLDGDRQNPWLGNLAYGTPSENRADCEKHGRAPRGSSYRSAKITEFTAVAIRNYRGKYSQSQLAEMFCVSAAAIQAIHDGRTWKHV